MNEKLSNQISVLKAILVEKEKELLTEVEKDVAAFCRTHPHLKCTFSSILDSYLIVSEKGGLDEEHWGSGKTEQEAWEDAACR